MKLDRRVKEYIDFELSHINSYRNEIKYADKAGADYTGVAFVKLQNTVNAIERMEKRLSELERDIFRLYYIDGIRSIEKITEKVNVSYETFNRKRNHIIELAAEEFGFKS